VGIGEECRDGVVAGGWWAGLCGRHGQLDVMAAATAPGHRIAAGGRSWGWAVGGGCGGVVV